jgi:hypothetical protein
MAACGAVWVSTCARSGEDLGPAGRLHGGGAVHDIGHDAGDVVRAPALDGQLDQLQHGVIQAAHRCQGHVQGVLAYHRGQAVGAQQVPVPGPGFPHLQVRDDVGAAVQRPQQQRALRMGGGLIGADAPVIHQRLDQRVVVRDLVEGAVPQQVGAGVPDVAQGHPAAGPQHRRQGRAHAADGGVGLDHVVQPLVGGRDRLGEDAQQVASGAGPVQLFEL